MTYFKSTYSKMGVASDPRIVADSYVEVSGATIAAGTVVDTRTVNQTYLQVEEDQKFDIQFTFVGLTGQPAKCDFVGRYEGNPAHDVWLYIWDYNLTVWTRVTAAANDFPSGTEDYSLAFDLPVSPDYTSGGEVELRIYHNSVAVAAHDMYIDYINVVEQTIALAMAGTAYQITGLTASTNTPGMTVNGAAGTITMLEDGDYDVLSTISFLGTEDAVFTLYLYIDGVEDRTLWERQLGSAGDVGSASGSELVTLTAGEVLSFRFVSDVDDAFLSAITMGNTVVKKSTFD